MALRTLALRSAKVEEAGMLSRSIIKPKLRKCELQVLWLFNLTSVTASMLTLLHIDKGVIPLSKVLRHSTILTDNKVRTVHLSRCSTAIKISPFEAVIPDIVAIMVKRQIVDTLVPVLRLQIIKAPLRPGEGVDIFRTFNGLRVVTTIIKAVAIVIRDPLCTILRHLHHHNQLLPLK